MAVVALSQKQTSKHWTGMSTLSPKADIRDTPVKCLLCARSGRSASIMKLLFQAILLQHLVQESLSRSQNQTVLPFTKAVHANSAAPSKMRIKIPASA